MLRNRYRVQEFAVIPRAVLFAIFLSLTSASGAEPNLQSVTTINGVKVFRDHEKSKVFYYLKANKRLVTRDDKPDFRYDVNRYIGNRATDDSDAFWVRGVIKFQTTSDFLDTSYQEILDDLVRQYGGGIELQAAPVSDSFNKLVYETVTPVDTGPNRGEIDGGLVTDVDDGGASNQPKRRFGSDKQRFTIGLESLDANFFWENFQRDNLILSLSYGWDVKGVVPDDEDGWQESTYAVGNSVAIDVSPSKYPSLFTKNELWQNVKVAHSNVTVMCYDFINVEDSDLYYVIVELRFRTLGNKTYQESVKFVADSHEYEKTVRFQLASDLEKGYEYRVQRLYEDGTFADLGWKSSDTLFLDVSMTVDELNARNPSAGEDT